jgi:hypothetical protein
MRATPFVFVLLLAAAPAARAQQAVPATPQSELRSSDLRPVAVPVGITRVMAPVSSAEAIESRRSSAESTAAIDPTARNVLAIIGAVVIVIALFALLN